MLNGELSLNHAVQTEGKRLMAKYRPVFEAISNAPTFSHADCEFTPSHAFQLGQQFDMCYDFDKFIREDASVSASASDLGMLPKTAIDLIATQYAISIAPLFASMQTLKERQGLVYFKKLIASGMINSFPYTTDADPDSNGLGAGFGPQARGGTSPGSQLIDARKGWVGGAMDYVTEQVSSEDISAAISGTTLNTQVRMFPIRRNIPVRVTATNGTAFEEGTFLNVDGSNERSAPLMTSTGWATGSVNFKNGIIDLKFNGFMPTEVKVSYMQDFESAADIPIIETSLTSMMVMSEIMALKQSISTMKAFEYSQRFGRDADSETLMDLAGVMADVESRRIVSSYVNMANVIESDSSLASQPLEFDITAPAGQSEYEYRQGFRYILVDADAVVNQNSGRGAANRYMVGHKMGTFISSLPKFEAAAANIAVGSHLLGYYDGKPVVRTRYMTNLKAPANAQGNYVAGRVDPNNALIAAYLNPQSPWDAPMVEATYMPVFVTQVSQYGHNPFQNQRAIATCKAFCEVVPYYVKCAALYNSALA